MLSYKTNPNIKPSPTEELIIRYLTKGNFYFEREVEFQDCVNPLTGALLRFDFYLPAQRTLIEYDGIEYHAAKERRRRDRIKTEYARSKGLRLIRIQGISNIRKLFNNELSIKIKNTTKSVVKQHQLVPQYNIKTVKDFIKVPVKDRPYVLNSIKKSNRFLWDNIMWKYYKKEILRYKGGKHTQFY